MSLVVTALPNIVVQIEEQLLIGPIYRLLLQDKTGEATYRPGEAGG
jgi:hypothetical protein